jgi:diaminohydroxyphosphoribosylaminopyrimidine deaminase/5-amino-6-(5-phosphoribosylamino)uracil reductase
MKRGDEEWMGLALEEARRGIGLTSPNPNVGAVVVKDGVLLGKGWHRRAGGPHAEVEALRAAEAAHGAAAVRGATVYVTLEPCSTSGRTPPCTGALMGAGVARVVWGADDPNPRHAGRAGEVLGVAGIEVTRGVLAESCGEVIAAFAKFITTGLPWVVAKAGISLDGKLTRPSGEGQWLTSEASRADAMQLRVRADAILVGAETVRVDDPALTVRGAGVPEGKEQPWRVVLTNSGRLPEGARIFTDEWRERTLVRRGETMEAVMRELAGRGVVTVLVEGGGVVHAQLFGAGLVDEAWIYVAPLLCGGGRPLIAAEAFGAGSCRLVTRDAVLTGGDVRIRLERPALRGG